MLKLFLWLRYLKSRKVVTLSITAVTLSTALLIVVASLFSSFIETFEKSSASFLGDIVIFPPGLVEHQDQLIDQLNKLNCVQASAGTLSGQGLLYLGKGNVRAVKVLGINPEQRDSVTNFKEFLLEQGDSTSPSFNQRLSPEDINSPPKTGGFVGIGVVGQPDEKTDLYDMDYVRSFLLKRFVLTTGSVSKEKTKRKNISFYVTDIVETGIFGIDDSFIYLPIDKLQQKLYPERTSSVADQVQIKLTEDVDIELALTQITGVWEMFATDTLGLEQYQIKAARILTAQQAQAQYIAELHKQMNLLLVIFSIISFSVVMLIFCILYMIVITRQKDIAIIKSCGVSNSAVASVFLGFGAFIGIIGSVLGFILGSLITKNINTIEGWIRVIFGLKIWKSSVYIFSRIPDRVDLKWALIIILCAIIAAMLGGLIPAITAALTKPVKILRYE